MNFTWNLAFFGILLKKNSVLRKSWKRAKSQERGTKCCYLFIYLLLKQGQIDNLRKIMETNK